MTDPNTPDRSHVPVHDEVPPESTLPAGQHADYQPGPDVPFKGERPRSRVDSPSHVFKYIGLGCLLVIVVAVLAATIGGWYLYRNARSIGANLVSTAAKQTVQQSHLPANQKQQIIAQIDQVTQDFKDHKITKSQMSEIGKQIAQSSLVSMGVTYFIEQKYVVPSGLTDEQKTQAQRTLQRLSRGVNDSAITQADFNALVNPLMSIDPQGKKKLEDKISDEDLRSFLKDARAAVDEAKVPDEPYTVDVAAEIQKAIDKVLNTNSMDQLDDTSDKAQSNTPAVDKPAVTP